ncbi:aminotransferase class IV [Halobacteriovorax sp. JY17]|uniref:aminotransferase class IV n=1 Tax=Halobacteriovorax sp. JY17 TaxID=2014617 RepID=UPI0025C48794|nr:aminotransferase class IV [Halobacteriovorax sp. JY17]
MSFYQLRSVLVKAIIYNNHQLFAAGEWEKMSLNRGLFFGESPFTTLKLSDGVFEALEFHLRRLSRSIYFLWNVDFKDFEESLLKGLKELYEESGDFYFRITFVKTLNEEVDFFIYKLPFENKEGDLNLEISKVIRGRTNIPNYLKVGNYLEYSLELREKKCSELVYFNFENELLECGTSNIFLVKDEKVLTPALIPGILDGVTRHLLLDFLRAENLSVRECSLSLEDLKNSDEIWLTNGLRGIRAASSLSGEDLSNKLLLKINEKFKKFVRNYGEATARG